MNLATDFISSTGNYRNYFPGSIGKTHYTHNTNLLTRQFIAIIEILSF